MRMWDECIPRSQGESEEADMPNNCEAGKPTNCVSHESHGEDLEVCMPCATDERSISVSVWPEVRSHMRRRLLGHVLQVIHLATDCLKVLCKERDWTRISQEGKIAREWHFKINEALRPWIFWWVGLEAKGPRKKIANPWANSFVSSD
eukprot:2620704-Prymnesium_polylepis.1